MDREHTHPSVRITFSKMERKSRRVHFAREGTETSAHTESTDYTYLSSQVSVCDACGCLSQTTDITLSL